MARSVRSDVHTIRELERKIAVQQRRLDYLERSSDRFTVGRLVGYEWECSHCARGWIVHEGDELRCTHCAYLRYL